jgi:uncharacterized protein (TIGR03083 family)
VPTPSPAAPVLDLLAHYHPADQAEARDLPRLRELLAQPDSPWPRSLPLHVTSSALIVAPDRGQVLLRWHPRQQAWLQVGGHGDPGETDPLDIAVREAAEETGLTDLVPWPDAALRHLAIVPVPAGKGEPAHEHADLRFVLATGHPERARPESPNAPLRWLTVAGAAASTEPTVRETLRRVGPLLAGGQDAGAPPVSLDTIDAAAASLRGTAARLTGADLRAPSLLPGWTRGHVLNHVARNADALAALLETARTGAGRPAYASAQARADAIEAGAGRPGPDLLADLDAAAARWRAEAAALPDAARYGLVAILGDAFPAAQVFARRLHETVLHHTDLGAGYGPADWPAAYRDLPLPPGMAAQRQTRLP